MRVSNRGSSGKLLHIAFSVCILIILALFIGNIVLILMALSLNNSVCRQATEDAAHVYASGANRQDMQVAVFHAINKGSAGGFFISHPTLTELRFYTEIGSHKQMLLVRTTTSVRLPAPFLVFFAYPVEDGRLLLRSHCEITLNKRDT